MLLEPLIQYGLGGVLPPTKVEGWLLSLVETWTRSLMFCARSDRLAAVDRMKRYANEALALRQSDDDLQLEKARAAMQEVRSYVQAK